jgi:hypothetical protein
LVSQPWDRQPGETAKAFAAFRRFLELGATRSLSKAAKAASRSVGLYKRWSRQWGWVERAAAWDGGQAREADRARQQLRQQLMERVVHDADQLRRLAMAKLGSLIVKDPVTGQVSPDPSVTPRDAVAVYRLHLDLLGMKGEGAAGPTADGEAGGSHLSGLSDEELRSYLEVLQERAGEPGGGEGR